MIESRQRRAALLVAACAFMELLDATIVTTSAPQMARSLAVPAGSISLTITAYMVTVATLIPVSGWMSARFGARRVLLAAIALFTLASLGCALSQSLPALVAFRVVQGAAGAMMVPVGRIMVFSESSKESLMRVTALLVWPALVAPVLAPIAGGLITTYASWHWLFLINLPLGAIALAAAVRVVRPQPQPQPGPLDVPGVVRTCLGIAGLTATCSLLAQSGSGVIACLGAAILTAALLTLAVRHLLRAASPLIELRTLRIRTLRASVSGTTVYFAVNAAGPFLVPLLVEEVFGWSAVKAGAVVLLIFVGNIGIKPATTFLYRRFGFRTVLTVATATMAATMACLVFVTVGTPIALLGAVLLISGIARSVGATGYMTVAFVDVPTDQMRHAGTLQTTAQQLASGFGVAGGAIALRLGHPLGSLFSSRPAPVDDYRVAFALVALVALTATAGALRLHPDAGNVLRGAQPARQQTTLGSEV